MVNNYPEISNIPRDKTALVTGSTSGIGRTIARALAAQGCNIVLNGFADISKVKTECQALADEFGIESIYCDADLTRVQEIEAMITEIEHLLGPVDILINNAGTQHVDTIEKFPVEAWDQILAVNLSAAFHTSRLTLSKMEKRGWGRIVNIASVHGMVASVSKGAYVAAKHGLIGLTRTIALEVAQSGVTCNAICPGYVLTPLIAKQIETIAKTEDIEIDVARKRLLTEKQPSGSFVTSEQISALVCFLCSDAAAQITGSAQTIDGGWTAQ